MDPSFGLELRRKAIHFLALIIPFGLFFFPGWFALPLLTAVTALFLAVELLRFFVPPIRALFLRFFGFLLRLHEDKALTGATCLLLSSTACALGLAALEGRGLTLSFEARVSLFYAFAFLILGDAAAAVVGKRFGRLKIAGSKTLMGTLACFLTAILIYLIGRAFITGPLPMAAGILGALLTAGLEVLPLRLDDNLRVAPVTCILFYGLLKSTV